MVSASSSVSDRIGLLNAWRMVWSDTPCLRARSARCAARPLLQVSLPSGSRKLSCVHVRNCSSRCADSAPLAAGVWIRRLAARFGTHRRTVREALRSATSPADAGAAVAPVMEGWKATVDGWLGAEGGRTSSGVTDALTNVLWMSTIKNSGKDLQVGGNCERIQAKSATSISWSIRCWRGAFCQPYEDQRRRHWIKRGIDRVRAHDCDGYPRDTG